MKCIKCGVELTQENTYHQYLQKGYYICKNCAVQKSRAYYQKNKNDPEFRKRRYASVKKWVSENREHYNALLREHGREYHRKHYLKIDGKYVHVDKRPRPQACELCNRPRVRLEYHHWDNDNPSKGIWLCRTCHLFAELIERNKVQMLMSKYEEFKKLL